MDTNGLSMTSNLFFCFNKKWWNRSEDAELILLSLSWAPSTCAAHTTCVCSCNTSFIVCRFVEVVTVGVTLTAAALDLLLRVWEGRSHTAEVCLCLCCDGTDVLTWCNTDVWCAVCPASPSFGVNSVCLLADDCCGDHRKCQGRCEEVWDLVQWQGGSVCGSGKAAFLKTFQLKL